MKMNNCIIIHGWESNPEDCWFPWIKKELENKDYKVFIPSMPNPDEPKIEEWISFLEENLKITEPTLLIGHSVGCQAILRHLEKHPNENIKKIIFVAPWMHLPMDIIEEEGATEIAKPWLETPIDWNKVSKYNYICIFSDNDPYVKLSEEEFFKEKLNAKTIVLQERGHFSGEEGITAIPEILDLI